jgi:hypothetical protein
MLYLPEFNYPQKVSFGIDEVDTRRWAAPYEGRCLQTVSTRTHLLHARTSGRVGGGLLLRRRAFKIFYYRLSAGPAKDWGRAHVLLAPSSPAVDALAPVGV